MSEKHFYSKSFNKTENAVPESYRNRIVCGDALNTLQNLPDNCIDMVLTSPPYNFNMDYDEHEDSQDWEQYFQTLNAVLDECVRVLKYGGRLIINVQPLFSSYVPTHHMISSHLTGRGMIWKAEILWEKNHRNCAYTAWGSWCSPASPYFKYTWEFIEVFCKGNLKKTGAGSDLTPDEFKSWTTAKWSIAPERKMQEIGHPAMFPLELADRCIRLFSFPGDIVLDPFNGAGTACLAAKNSDRDYIGVDISENYCNIARNRVMDNPCFVED